MQTLVAAMKATRQTTMRTRSSVRCSTRLSRSSWPTWRSAVAMVRRCGYLARSALANDLAFERRLLALGAPQRRLGLAAIRAVVIVVVVIAALAADRLLELAHSGAELLAQAGQPLGAENEEHDHQNDDQLHGTDVWHPQLPLALNETS